ncbi:MAG: alpha/beta fold hydrolase [Polyangiaceae bacterium]|nr:alpha/beta fold hydrolase [Polyangiaceae bacterium]MCB9605876.1 alpha/beta fold hydrolase [Polyangiaceae bacterium]
MSNPEPEASPVAAPPPPQKDARRKGRRVLWLAILLVGVPGVAIVVLTLTSLRATNLQALEGRYPAFDASTGRKPLPAGACGLNQRSVGQKCELIAVSELKTEEIKYPSSIPEKGVPELAGTLTLPQGIGGGRPAVLLVHGSGPADRHLTVPGDLVRKLPDNFAVFDALADWFARQGFVVLAYDKRSCGRCYGASSFDPQRFSFQDFETDAIDGLKYLKTRPEVDPSALVVLGASQGGGLAPFIANQAPGVAAVISLSGLFESFSQALIDQLQRISDIRKQQWDYFGPLNVFFQRSKLQDCFDNLNGPQYVPEQVCIGGGVTQKALKEYSERSATGVQELKRLKVPLFLSQGTLDRNVSPQLFQQLKADLSTQDAELHFIAGMDHSQTQALPPAGKLELDSKLLEYLQHFLSTVPLPGGNAPSAAD